MKANCLICFAKKNARSIEVVKDFLGFPYLHAWHLYLPTQAKRRMGRKLRRVKLESIQSPCADIYFLLTLKMLFWSNMEIMRIHSCYGSQSTQSWHKWLILRYRSCQTAMTNIYLDIIIMQFQCFDWVSSHGIWAILPCSTKMASLRVSEKNTTKWARLFVFLTKQFFHSRLFDPKWL